MNQAIAEEKGGEDLSEENEVPAENMFGDFLKESDEKKPKDDTIDLNDDSFNIDQDVF